MADKIIERVTLNFTDLTGKKTGCTTLGSNKFWKGEVVDHGDGTGSFLCKWGPTGSAGKTTGSKVRIPLGTAIKTFNKKRSSKLKKGYTELQVRNDAEEAAKAAAAGVTPAKATKAKSVSSRKFHPNVGRLLRTIYGSTANTVRRGLSAQAGSTDENPIGNLSDGQLDIGGGILDEIESALKAEFGRETTDNKASTLPLGRDSMPSGRIIDLTNNYMSNVPRTIAREDRGRRNLHKLVVSSYGRLEEQRKFLQLLRDAHVAKAVFQQAAAQTTTGSKEAVWYDGLGCDIEALAKSDAGYKFVAEVFNTAQSQHNHNWWRGGKCRLRLVNVYKFTRMGTESAFDAYKTKVERKPDATGQVFAWHGTRTANLLGISKSGLLMPENLPRGVHISGKAFGLGIYHAPAWNATGTTNVSGNKTDGTNGALKSMNYTGVGGAYYGGSESGNAFMYLQELALGIPDVRYSPCWDQKRPTGWPSKDWTYANAGGCRTLTHDEIVTYDENAQIFRYLVEIAVD